MAFTSNWFKYLAILLLVLLNSCNLQKYCAKHPDRCHITLDSSIVTRIDSFYTSSIDSFYLHDTIVQTQVRLLADTSFSLKSNDSLTIRKPNYNIKIQRHQNDSFTLYSDYLDSILHYYQTLIINHKSETRILQNTIKSLDRQIVIEKKRQRKITWFMHIFWSVFGTLMFFLILLFLRRVLSFNPLR